MSSAPSSAPALKPSPLAVADLDESGQATYTFYADSAADWQWTDNELAGARLDDAACLHTGSLALIQQPGGARIEDYLSKAREHVTVSIAPNVRPLLVPPAVYRERLPRWCALADILRLSKDDLALLLPGVSPQEACDTWHTAGARLVVIKAVTDACTFGARVAALTCSVTGANPPGRTKWRWRPTWNGFCRMPERAPNPDRRHPVRAVGAAPLRLRGRRAGSRAVLEIRCGCG